jgi:drug/metabolite transporter (DMT)-like permease
MLSGAYFLNERVSPLLWVALALVACGIWLVNRPRAKTASA